VGGIGGCAGFYDGDAEALVLANERRAESLLRAGSPSRAKRYPAPPAYLTLSILMSWKRVCHWFKYISKGVASCSSPLGWSVHH
jgi:hypothetical protein